MTPSRPPDSSRQGRLEEVLEEYMQCLDRGEAVDREQLLARHPELVEELRSYFAGSDDDSGWTFGRVDECATVKRRQLYGQRHDQ